jgi:hypothetical protein
LESAISRQWYQLYENNPKIQAFAVAKGAEIVWQTENLNLLEDIKQIVIAPKEAASNVSASGVKYKRVASTLDTYIGSASDNKGHLLIVRINEISWAIAWAESTSVPELTLVDLTRTAIHLSGDVR